MSDSIKNLKAPVDPTPANDNAPRGDEIQGMGTNKGNTGLGGMSAGSEGSEGIYDQGQSIQGDQGNQSNQQRAGSTGKQ